MGTQCQTRSIISESTADKKIQKMQRLKVGNQPCCSVIKGNSPLSCRPNHRDTTEAINKTRSERTLIRTLTCIVSKKKKKKKLAQPITDEPSSSCLFPPLNLTEAKTVRRDYISQFPTFRDEKSVQNSEVRDLTTSGLISRPPKS